VRFATVRLGPIFRLRQSALPAPPRQCLVSSPARLKLEPVIPARQGGIARFSHASCVRAMSTGRARRTLSSDKHDTNATGKSNGSSRLPAFSFRDSGAMEGRRRTTHTTRMGGQVRRDTALASRRAPDASEIHSLSQTDMLKSARSRTAIRHARSLMRETPPPLPERHFRHDICVAVGRQRKPLVRVGFWAMIVFTAPLERLGVRLSPSHRRPAVCPPQGAAGAGAIPGSVCRALRRGRSTRRRRSAAPS
jgi:hypothetical protein